MEGGEDIEVGKKRQEATTFGAVVGGLVTVNRTATRRNFNSMVLDGPPKACGEGNGTAVSGTQGGRGDISGGARKEGGCDSMV